MIGQKVRILRLRRGPSQEYLAEELGISQSTIARIEAGKSELPASLLPKLCGILQVSLSYFFELIFDSQDQVHGLDQNSLSDNEVRTRVAQMKSNLEFCIKDLNALSSLLTEEKDGTGPNFHLK